jgi:hypothetical protein
MASLPPHPGGGAALSTILVEGMLAFRAASQ